MFEIIGLKTVDGDWSRLLEFGESPCRQLNLKSNKIIYYSATGEMGHAGSNAAMTHSPRDPKFRVTARPREIRLENRFNN